MKKTLIRLAALSTTTALSTLAVTAVHSPKAEAQYNTPYFIGEIFLVGSPFCPADTLEADGSLLNIVDHQSLFSLYGTTYGGDGRTTFGLPNMPGPVEGTQYCIVEFGIYPSRS
ncbi:MAG: phage tail protein [Cyanobacteria bacterium P01_D01_bin.56]